MSYGECSYKNCDLFGGHIGPHTCAGRIILEERGDEMSASIPEDLREAFAIFPSVHEQIAALKAQNQQLREALEAIIRRVALVSPYYEMARAALAATEPKS
jgi:hypothetical protein